MSERVTTALHFRRNGQTEGWVFPSDSRHGHITSVAKAFETVRSVVNENQLSMLSRHSPRHTAVM